MISSIKRILTLAKRNATEIVRDPLSLIFMALTPLILLVLFYFAFHNLTAQFEMKYLAPGIVVFAQTFITLFAGILISSDRNSSFLTRLYVSKAKSSEFILGYTLALLPLAVLQAVVFFAIGGIIDPSLWSLGMLGAVLLSVVPAMLFIGFGIVFGSVCGEKSVGGISSVIVCAQSVLSGMWFPLEGLDKGFIAFMDALPFRNANKLLVNVAMGGGENVLTEFAILLAYTVAVYALAIIVYRKKMKQN